MTIRQATEKDATDIARIHVDTWGIAYNGIVPDSHLSRLSKTDRAKRWARTLSGSSEGTRVAVAPDGRVIGWTSFGPSRDNDGQGIGELYAIYLDPAHWGQGIGKALMNDAVSRLYEDGFASITLWVLQENTRTRAFYERAGFISDGAVKTIEIDGKQLVELRYRKTAQPDAPVDALAHTPQPPRSAD
jgi:L-amino acid N-acyltransferase YncA